MKRILSLFVFLTTYISSFAVVYQGVSYTTKAWDDGKAHVSTELGTATAEYPTVTSGDVVIVKKVITQIREGKGYIVTSIAANAFANRELITSVTISSSVESIGAKAFANMTLLRYIVCEGSTPATLGASVFENCGAALAIVVPESAVETYKTADGWKDLNIVTQIPEVEDAIKFADTTVKVACVKNWDTNGDGELDMNEAAAVTDLGSVFTDDAVRTNIKSFDELQYFTGLKTIGKSAFENCKNLTSTIIPSSVTTIERNAFGTCLALTSINIPNSVTSIGEYNQEIKGETNAVAIPVNG